nr:DNA mismatch repair protein MSH7 [Tanacetum cinerariifolium]
MVCKNTLDGGHDNIHSTSNKSNLSYGRDKESSLSGFPRMKNVIDLDETAGEDDITGPETPGTRPLVPRLKRVQEDGFSFGSTTPHSSIDDSKMVKFSHDLSAEAENKKPELSSEISKRVTFSFDSLAENKKPELSSDNIKRSKFFHDLPAEINKPELPSDNVKRSKFFHDLLAEIKKPELPSDNLKRSKIFHDLPAEIKKPELPSEIIRRSKYFHDLAAENKKELASDTANKFDWLHPSKIKDANGRRPGNPLYDKRTLYVPPDVLRKMSASQKQYWSVKSEYMDVLIFF